MTESSSASMEWIELDKLQVDIDEGYQRTLDERRVSQMVAAWRPELNHALSVSRRADGSLWVVDGQTRLAAMRRRGDGGTWCQVTSMERRVEAATFRDGQTQRKNITPYERHRASLIAEDERSWAIETALDDHGWRLASSTHATDALTAISAIYRIYDQGGESLLRDVLVLCGKAWPREKRAFQSTLIPGIAAFLRVYSDIDREELAKRLAGVAPDKLLRDARVAHPNFSSASAAAVAIVNEIVRVYNWRRTKHVIPPAILGAAHAHRQPRIVKVTTLDEDGEGS